MKSSQVVRIAVLLFWCAFVFGQTNSASKEQKSEPSGNPPEQKQRPNTPSAGSVEILSETFDFDFGPYIARVQKDVKQNWYILIPDSARPPVMKTGKVAIEFAILKHGKIANMKVATSSGDIALDRAAWASIANSQPFAPLPSEFIGDHLSLRFYFYYNPPKTVQITISPSSAQVVSGTKQHFSAVVKGSTNTKVLWSVFGMGCREPACGTISSEGVYDAPSSVPEVPDIAVTATLASNSLRYLREAWPRGLLRFVTFRCFSHH